MKYQSYFRQLSLLFFGFFLSSFSILFFARALFFIHIQDALPLENLSDDIWRAFWIGGRFDAKVTAIAYAPLLLSGLIAAACERTYVLWLKLASGYHSIIVFLYIIGCFGNYYYYLTYGSHVDLFVFGLLDDDSQAVLNSIWQDYPILQIIGFSLVVSGFSYWLSHRFLSRWGRLNQSIHWHWSITSLAVITILLLTFIVARGSLGTHPLKRYHASVSPHKPLNMITPNVFMAIDWAISEYKEQSHFEPVSESQLTAQMQKLLGQPTPLYHTPNNTYLSKNSPHVVVAMMEGMGMNILIEDKSQTNDLLGSLRPHWKNGFLFKRFMAGTSATIDSIVMMLFHSPVATISHSSIQKKSLPSSAILPYKRAGYNVVFLYGGNSMWRNLANYLPVQGFDRVYDENDIVEAFPESEAYVGDWGVADGYTFKFANKLLEEAEKPTLIFIMTVTNHSPYEVPDYYQLKPTMMTTRLSSLLGHYDEQTDELLSTFQYAADSLGQFINRVKQSEILKEKTVIAVTGDHRMRYSSTNNLAEYGLSYSVPFFLSVPDSILQHTDYIYDSMRIGSHRDIFPTLYHFSLSDQEYITLGGENLLASKGVSNIGYNTKVSINQFGAFNSMGAEFFYPWSKEDPLLNESVAEKQSLFDMNWGKEYHRLQDFYLRSQVLPMKP